MSETIREVNILEQHNEDFLAYAIYVARRRAIPDFRDGLKYVHRKILYAMMNDFKAYSNSSFIKTASVIGRVLEKYHPHGDTAVNDAIKPMTNWFEIYMPLILKHGSFGNITGDPASAARYTGVKLSQYGEECILAELRTSPNSVDWQENYDGKYKEPIFLPAAVPNLLINGAFGIAVGLKIQVPKHNLGEVIDATIKLIKNPSSKITLIPDNCMGCDIIESDFDRICNTGKGKYTVRANVEITEYKGKPALKVTSLPDMVFWNTVEEEIGNLVKSNNLPQVIDIKNTSDLDKRTNDEVFSAYIVLKPGSDPNYVLEFLYNATKLQATIPVNLEVIKDETPVLMNYKEYLLNFIAFRRQTKFRMYASRLKVVKTKMHELYLYIKVLESGEIDNIISMIRKQTGTDDKVYVEYLVNKLNITPLQAKFILGTDIRKLSMGYLNKYKQDMATNNAIAMTYEQKLTNPHMIDEDIVEELTEFKKKYSFPRKSRIVSKTEASGIPQGIFKLVFTERGFIKKLNENDNIGSLSGDQAKYIFTADNADNLILFDEFGKAFKLPVHKIPFAAKGSNGIDIRLINRYIVSSPLCVIPESIMKKLSENKQNFIYTITVEGNIKRMDIEDFINTPPSGIIYTKLDGGDSVKDILFMNEQCDLLIYSGNKALRINGTEPPYLRRSTKGNNAMSTKESIGGMACIYPGATDIVVVTYSGRVNRISINALPLSSRAKAGSSIIKLGGSHDEILQVIVAKQNQSIRATTKNEVIDVPISEIPEGSSISLGSKMFSNLLKVELV